MIRISSPANQRVRRALALRRSARRRHATGLMIVEGLRLTLEVASSPVVPDEVFVTQAFIDNAAADAASPTPDVPPGGAVAGVLAESLKVEALLERLAEESTVLMVTEAVMDALSDTVTPQGVLAVVPIPDLPAPRASRRVLIADGVRDPGNLGTMLRAAWAAGVTEVLLPPGTVDHTNPKAVRAAMGAHFRLPVHQEDWGGIWRSVDGLPLWLAEARAGLPYDAVDWASDFALVVGGEADGASAEVRARATCAHIPMAGGVESLNAAVAAAVLLFEAARHRRVAETHASA